MSTQRGYGCILSVLCFLCAFAQSAADQRFNRMLQRQDSSLIRLAAREPDYNPETKIDIAYVGKMNVTYETLFAFLWVMIVACGPLLIVRNQGGQLKDGQFSWTRIVQSLITALGLLGGIVAFTQTIMFESSHWEGARTLTIVESVYLLAQIITTVGYGDIVPAYPRGQVVVGIYVLLCLFLIADVVNVLCSLVLKRLDRLAEEAAASFEHRVIFRGQDGAEDEANKDAATAPRLFKKPTVSFMPLISSGATLVFFIVAGILFYHFYPGEEKTWLEAIYMSVITLSTTGFGAFTATTEVGKVFGAFWMLFGVGSLVGFAGSFADIMIQFKTVDAYKSGHERRKMDDGLAALGVQSDQPGSKRFLDKTDFLCFAMLQLELTDQDTLRGIEWAFDHLEPDASGTVGRDKIFSLVPQHVKEVPREP